MQTNEAESVISQWPEESREAAELVIREYGVPDEGPPSLLRWFDAGPWKRVTASRTFFQHAFPAPHIDSVESVIDYHVPVDKVGQVTAFDGSVVVERTAGEVMARCHDVQANYLALNLMHDIVSGEKDVESARDYYAEEFLAARKGDPTPYMDGLRFEPEHRVADPDSRVLSDQQLQKAVEQGS